MGTDLIGSVILAHFFSFLGLVKGGKRLLGTCRGWGGGGRKWKGPERGKGQSVLAHFLEISECNLKLVGKPNSSILLWLKLVQKIVQKNQKP